MAINISNILAQLNTKMTTDSSSTTTELLRRVKAYNDLSNAGRVFEYQSYGDLPTVDSSNIGQLAYVKSSLDDSFGTFFFAKALANDSGYLSAIDSTNSGWQKIVLNANDSDNFADIVSSGAGATAVQNNQGENYGYTADGFSAISSPSYRREIDKFSFASGGNATDVGDTLSSGDLEASGAGQSSTSHGYHSGDTSPNLSTNIIQKYSFTVDGNATDVGDLTLTRGRCAGTSSDDNGYTHGGGRVPNLPTSYLNTIDKFPFATDANATDVGDLVAAAKDPAGQSSSTHGYASGGKHPSYTNGQVDIQKYSFSTDGNSSDVGDLTRGSYGPAGQNSSTHGYTSAGQNASPFNQYGNIIDKFSFSSDANATDVGDASEGRIQPAGTSSTSDGYTQGGGLPSPAYASNVIDKFPFSSDASATDVGDLTLGRQQCSGSQY